MTSRDILPILITGATGYLGQALVAAYQAKDIPVIQMGRSNTAHLDVVADLTDAEGFRAAMSGMEVSHIVHTAAVVPSSAAGYDDVDAGRISVTMAQTVADYAQTHGVPVTLVSSMTVYPASASNPVAEDTPTGQATSAYAQGKRDAESVFQKSGVYGFAARIPGLFGGARPGGIVSGIKTTLKGNRKPALPDAPLLWAAMHVKDAAEALVALSLVPTDSFQAVNVGYAGPISINRLTDIAADVHNQPIENLVVHPVFEYDLSRWSALTGLTPKPFNTALREFLN